MAVYYIDKAFAYGNFVSVTIILIREREVLFPLPSFKHRPYCAPKLLNVYMLLRFDGDKCCFLWLYIQKDSFLQPHGKKAFYTFQTDNREFIRGILIYHSNKTFAFSCFLSCKKVVFANFEILLVRSPRSSLQEIRSSFALFFIAKENIHNS